MKTPTIILLSLFVLNIFLYVLQENYVPIFGWLCAILMLLAANSKDGVIDSMKDLIKAQDDLIVKYSKIISSRNTDNPESSDI